MHSLEPHAGTRRKVRIERNRPCHRLLNGYVLDSENGLALIHAFDDFEPDGYAIIRERDIVSVRQGEHEAFWDRMLEAEGLLGGLDDAPTIDLDCMRDAIGSAIMYFPFLAIHREDEDSPDEEYYFAQWFGDSRTHVRLRCVDGLARWEEDPVTLPLDDITMVELGTPYLTRFAKYVESD